MLIGIDGNEANVFEKVGANVYAWNILQQLYQKSQKDSLQFKIYLKNKPLLDFPPENQNWRYEIFGPRKLWTQWRLPLQLFLKKPKPNVFFTPGHYAPRFSPIPTVISIMDLAFLKFPQDFREQDLQQLKSWTAYSVKNTSHILTISKNTKKDIVQCYGIEPNKITVTYPGYDRKRFKVQSATQLAKLKTKYEIKGDYLIYIGTLQPRKNVVRLIEAFSTLNSPNLKLVIVGKKGWLYEDIFKTTQRLNLDQQVIFTNFIPEKELPILLRGARAYVLPSLYEGFGIPVVEAMACEVPVVVSKVSSLPEIVGQAGVYIDNPESIKSIFEALKKVLKFSKKEKRRLIAKGLKQVQQFSWEKCAQKTLEILLKIGENN